MNFFSHPARRIARALTGADTCTQRAAMYGPCDTVECPTCGGPRPVTPDTPVTPLARALEVITDRERIRNELDSCEDFGVDPRYL